MQFSQGFQLLLTIFVSLAFNFCYLGCLLLNLVLDDAELLVDREPVLRLPVVVPDLDDKRPAVDNLEVGRDAIEFELLRSFQSIVVILCENCVAEDAVEEDL